MGKQTINSILDTLKNGKQHALEEITEKIGIKEPKVRLIVAFLRKYQFVEVNKSGKIKLSPSAKQFLDKLDKTDPAPFYEEITARRA